MNNKALKISIPIIIFAALSGLLFKYSPYFLWIFPAYGLIFIWFSFYNKNELEFIVLFLCTAMGFIIPKLSSFSESMEFSAFIFAEIFMLWILFYILHKIAALKNEGFRKMTAEISSNLSKRKHIEDEVKRYESHQVALLNRIKFQSKLSSSIQYISSSSNTEEIREKLGELVIKYFNDAATLVHSGTPRDTFEKWVFDRKTPLFIKDSTMEKRFSSSNFLEDEKSIVITPLNLFGSVAGFIRISSEKPQRFKNDDLRVLEIIASICAVSMENIRLFEQVEQLAVKDGLTQMYTHRAFEGRLQEEILRSARGKTPFSLLMIDIDHFKKYNDTYGHQAGDSVLKTVSGILKENIREVDFAARYGGEEFAIILTGIGKADAASLAEHLRITLEAAKFNFGGKATGVTASFGVSEFPADATIESQLIRAADERLYRAKDGGRHMVVY
ncbi:MAG: sensor domain-containing diguanylate cyclase, partial [Elusimicrobiota bacterium]|nr:sensor domain-containing diguanylate cyclase [Elusimicrobiota bacterium]